MANTDGTELCAAGRAARKRGAARTVVLHPDGSVEVRASPSARKIGQTLRLRADGSVRVHPAPSHDDRLRISRRRAA